MFRKVLIANRGEIAVRIIRSLRDLGTSAVAVYSEADRQALHVQLADEAYPIGPARAADSYLRADRLIEVGCASGCDAVIPGYGFLSENAEFATACEQAGLTFVGPSPEAMRVMGLKPEARAHMAQAGVPVVPGGPASTLEEARQSAQAIGFPLLIKAAAGGGGRGMRRIEREQELDAQFERAQAEALAAFGDGTVYLEKLVSPARHIEVQVLGDRQGNLIHLLERDCSVQRRHQKVVEESPSPGLPQAARQALCQTALRGAASVGYYSAGTFEFLVDAEHNHYFLEMNTRLQVEHPVTELRCRIDLVAEMLRVAAGEPLSISQQEVVPLGAAIECRIYAESPERGFLPAPGVIRHYREPGGPGVRVDSGVRSGVRVTTDYDPLLAKLCVWGRDRAQAVARMSRALREFEVEGPGTNLEFHRQLLAETDFAAGDYHTGYIAEHPRLLEPRNPEGSVELAAAYLVLQQRRERARAPQTAQSTSSQSPATSSQSEWVQAYRRWRLGS